MSNPQLGHCTSISPWYCTIFAPAPRSALGGQAVDVRFGVFVPQGWRRDLVMIEDPVEQFEAMTAVARAADAGPWDSIWIYDHFHTSPEPTLETTFECWTTTAALARETKRVRVGQLVSCNGYRNPSLFAKMASTVDVVSHGRLNAGIGAGWYEQEWRAYGYGFPNLRERMGMLREACEVIHRMWTEEHPRFQGHYYTIDGPINEPRGVQKPHPPLWIAGGGERVTLRLVAEWGDACNVRGDPETVRHKLEVLKRHCETVGRDYNQITKSTEVHVHPVATPNDIAPVLSALQMASEKVARTTIVGTPEDIGNGLGSLVDAGIDYIIVYLPLVAYDHEPLHRFAEEIIPQFNL
jgi:F420-dependent oxidoreductase-like protein